MESLIFTLVLAPNPTRDNPQITVKSTQFKPIQATFTTFDSPPVYMLKEAPCMFLMEKVCISNHGYIFVVILYID